MAPNPVQRRYNIRAALRVAKPSDPLLKRPGERPITFHWRAGDILILSPLSSIASPPPSTTALFPLPLNPNAPLESAITGATGTGPAQTPPPTPPARGG